MAAPAAADRSKLLQELDLRHDALLRELDELNQRVEQALGQLRPSRLSDSAPAALKISRRDAETQSSEED
jgi:hypothetical protein